MHTNIDEFIKDLSSKSPAPGGGGASAFVGALGVSLCSMVANLTLGKKAYAEFEPDIEEIIQRANASTKRFIQLIDQDEQAFLPLAAAYSLPKDTQNRKELLQAALQAAVKPPLDMIKELFSVVDMLELLFIMGSKMALSDVGVAASFIAAAVEGAVINVCVNTKLMSDKELAQNINEQAAELSGQTLERARSIYTDVLKSML